MASGRNLVVNLISDVSKFTRGLTSAERSASTFATRTTQSFKKVGLAVGLAAAAFAGLAVKMGVDAVKAAISDQAAQKRLAVALRNTAKATREQVAAVEDWITAQEKRTGLEDNALRTGFARIVRSTKNVTRAQQIANTATEIAVALGKDYEVVATALSKANDGQTTALRKLGISTGDQAKNYAELATANKNYAKAQLFATGVLADYGAASKEYAKALEKVKAAGDKVTLIKSGGTKWLAELNKQFRGSNAADAETMAGKIRRLSTAWEEFQESFGQGVIGNGDAAGGIDELTKSLYENQKAAEAAGAAVSSFLASLVSNIAPFEVGAMKIADLFDDIEASIEAANIQLADWTNQISDAEAQRRNDALGAADKRRNDALLQAQWELTGHTGPAPGTGITFSGSGIGSGVAGGGGGGGGGFNGDGSNGGASWGSTSPRPPLSAGGAFPQWTTGYDPARVMTRTRDAASTADARTAQLGAITRIRK